MLRQRTYSCPPAASQHWVLRKFRCICLHRARLQVRHCHKQILGVVKSLPVGRGFTVSGSLFMVWLVYIESWFAIKEGSSCGDQALAHSKQADSVTSTRRQAVVWKALKDLNRPALHAQTLGFTHPVSGDRLQFTSELPSDFQQTMSQLSSLL